MAIPESQRETAALLRGLAGRGPIETHISAVFVGADTVWKLRKAVTLPFLDFSRLAERERTARREFDLNAHAAAGMYRDVVPVTRGPDGTLALGGDGTVVDWVVRMARVPEADFLDAVAARGGLDDAMLDALGDAVAGYHAALAPVVSAPADALRRIIEGNRDSALSAGLDTARTEGWTRATLAALDRLAGWLRARAAAGFVRRCHGDLHLGNMCIWNGHPVPFDALEFDEALATIDTGYDLAFLLMDLDRRAGRAAANRVLNRYVARTGDAALVAGLPLFLSLRAMVRAHVEARSGHAEAAADYLDRAEDDLRPRPACVVAVGGLPGTGKSTLARALAPGLGRSPGALVLRSDEIRKRQHHAAPETRLPQDAYSAGASAAVFAELARLAGEAVRGGHTVIADGTFMDPAHRAAIRAAAGDAPFVGLWLQAPLAVLEARVAARRGDASDADLAVLRRAAAADPGAGDWLALDAGAADTGLAQARAALGRAGANKAI